jgi:excisionase family DNA binding protein
MDLEDKNMEENKQMEYMTVEEAAKFLQVNQETIRRALRDKKIKGDKTVIGQWKVERASLEEYAKNYRVE